MAKFECELHGDFDEIISHIERTVMIEPEEASDFGTGDVRIVVRTYNLGAGFTLTQNGENISIIVTSKEDSVFGGGIYFELIKDAVEEYSSARGENNDTLPYFAAADYINTVTEENISEEDIIPVSIGAENIYTENIYTEGTDTENISEHFTYTKKDITENVDEESSYIEDIAEENFRAESDIDTKTAECSSDTKTQQSKSDNASKRAIKLVCKCDEKYRVELYKSTFEHIGVDVWKPLGDSSGEDRYVKLTQLWRESYYFGNIVKRLESIVVIDNYDYYTMIRGVLCLIAGIAIVVLGSVFHFSDIYDLDSFILYLIVQALRIFMVYQVFRGLMYIVPFTQKWFRIFEWGCGKRFIFKTKLIPVGGSYMPDGSRGVSKTNEMVLYDEHAELYYGTGIKKVHYGDCVSVFETDNLFVIMVQNNYIVSFQKSDMSSEQQILVREILSPYYKIESEYSVF